ncbi:MAG: J domain-containing protein [Elusimicrobia bacterium]|nr:J domain-containing protein [Elusimicrobiota bacterium]
MPSDKDYYRLLQVHPDADPAIIKSAYRTLMSELNAHPDKGGSTQIAQQLNEAYETLSDAVKRFLYDKERPKPQAVMPQPEARRAYPAPAGQKRSSPAPNAIPQVKCPICGNTIEVPGPTSRQTRVAYIRELSGFQMYSGHEISHAEAEQIAIRLVPN